ncbi:MAG TPA: nicotinate (nicotinamide) nucleotide adenylyltransferase [Burkholderiaceae bacterium]|nr:nicotinate (nicotinamide) nucleotide adenylyltransferase [Burkholderiaceae bacterium]
MHGPVIGLLGGSFDPIHVGHVQLARDALAHLPLDEVRFVPAAQPWQKGHVTDAAHRAHMVELAIGREPRCVLDMHEIERGGTTYTIDTLRALRAGAWREASLVLIMGSDQFERFDTWRDWQAVADLAHIVVARRAGVAARLNPALEAFSRQRHCGPAELAHRAAGGVVEFPMTAIDASATEARRLLANPAPDADRRLAQLLPPPVLDYIRVHRLYS